MGLTTAYRALDGSSAAAVSGSSCVLEGMPLSHCLGFVEPSSCSLLCVACCCCCRCAWHACSIVCFVFVAKALLGGAPFSAACPTLGRTGGPFWQVRQATLVPLLQVLCIRARVRQLCVPFSPIPTGGLPTVDTPSQLSSAAAGVT